MKLPSPPTNEEAKLYLDPNRFPFYLATGISTLCLLAGNFVFLWSNPSFWPYLIFLLLLLFYLFLSLLIGITGKTFQYKLHQSKITESLWLQKPTAIDIYLPVCGEYYPVLSNTWRAVQELISKSEHHISVYVLDDKRDPTVKLLAEQFKFNYITRPTNDLKKAGNLRNAFSKTSGEFIVIFDADFCPRHDFLLHTLPYFEDEMVAIVQSPQFFSYDSQENDIAKGASGIQELFYRLIQQNRDSHGGAICVGTNAVYRRVALIPFGGTAPMPYSEDVHTGFQVTASEWLVRYLPLNLAAGLCPSTWEQYFIQQYRWAMGSISLMLSKKFWRAKITIWQRMCYLTGMLYYTVTGVGIIAAPLPGLFILYFHPEKIYWFNLLFSIPSFLCTSILMRAWMRQPFKKSILEARHVAYFAHLFALVDFLRQNTEAWLPTGVKQKSSRYKVFKNIYAAHTFIIFYAIAIKITYLIADGADPWKFALAAFFASFNMYIAFGPFMEMSCEGA